MGQTPTSRPRQGLYGTARRTLLDLTAQCDVRFACIGLALPATGAADLADPQPTLAPIAWCGETDPRTPLETVVCPSSGDLRRLTDERRLEPGDMFVSLLPRYASGTPLVGDSPRVRAGHARELAAARALDVALLADRTRSSRLMLAYLHDTLGAELAASARVMEILEGEVADEAKRELVRLARSGLLRSERGLRLTQAQLAAGAGSHTDGGSRLLTLLAAMRTHLNGRVSMMPGDLVERDHPRLEGLVGEVLGWAAQALPDGDQLTLRLEPSSSRWAAGNWEPSPVLELIATTRPAMGGVPEELVAEADAVGVAVTTELSSRGHHLRLVRGPLTGSPPTPSNRPGV